MIIERAVKNGLSEVQVHRFPNALCTDHGRAINQQEKGWEKTAYGRYRRKSSIVGAPLFATRATSCAARSGNRFSRRHAGGCRHDAELR